MITISRMPSPHNHADQGRSPGEFATTRWSIVLSAGKRGNRAADEALATLCQRYWLPLYVYVRQRGRDQHEAQDLTQEFFSQLLEKNSLERATPERGRFRSFLLTALKNFLANEWDKTQAQKRGGGQSPLSLALADGESRYSLEPAHELTPERLFERQWTLTLLELVTNRLQGEFIAAGKTRHFELFKAALAGDRHALDYATIAAELDTTEDAVRQAAHRLRKRYRELLREEVAQTIAEPGEVDDEIRSLFESLG